MYVRPKNTNLQNVPPTFCKFMSGHNIFDIYFHLPPQRAVPCHGEEPHCLCRTLPLPAAATAAAAAAPNRRTPYSAAAVAFADDNGETASATSPPWAPPVMAYTTASDTPLIG